MSEPLPEHMAVAVLDEREGGTSASSAEADSLCKGRHLAQKDKPEQSSADAQFGMQIHAAHFTGRDEELSTEQLSVYESQKQITNDLLVKVFGIDHDKVKVFKERRFKVGVLQNPGVKILNPTRFKHSGKPDFVARLGAKALVVEYKSLPGDVASAPTNMQLRDQAVLVAGELMCNEVYTAVNQPLVTHTPDLCLYNKEALKQAEQELFVRVRASNDPKAKRTAGEKQCQFCLARSDCPEYQTYASSLLPTPAQMFGVPVKDWTDEQRAKFMEGKRVAQRWLDETYAQLKKLMGEVPGCVPGYHMSEGDRVREINNPQELFQRLVNVAKEAGSGDIELLVLYLQCVKVNKGDFKDLVRKVTGFKGKKLDTTIEAMMTGIVDESRKEGSIEKIKA